MTVGTHLVEAYVALSFWLVDVEVRKCRSRVALVACTRTYSGQGARKKIRPRTYIRAGSQTPTRAYVWPGLVYMAGSERRNCVIVVFMGRQRNAPCSSGGNRTRGSQPAWTEWNAWSCSLGGLGWNRRWKRGLAYRRTEETALCSTGHGRNRILFIGRGLAYRKTEKTDFCWTSYFQNRVLLIGRGVAYHKTEETNLCWSATVETGVLFIGGVWRTAKQDSTGYYSSPSLTPSSLHELLFIHHRPPPASTCDCSSTGSCSSSLHRALLHRLLFNQPSPRAPVQPPLHGLLFI